MQMNVIITWKKLVILAMGFLAAFGLNLMSAPPVSAGDWGVCKECHDEVAAKFDKSFHGRSWMAQATGSECSSCHGSADKHADDPGKHTIITFGKDSKQSAEEQSARCLSCHAGASILTLWDMGSHSKNDVACVSCHKIHQEKQVVSQPDTCFGCHRDVRVDSNKQSHHPIIEGKVKCSDCHNPHGTLSHHMIKAENVNQLCYQCHADKRGPFIWEHPPVEESCVICHSPHGSRHAQLMTEKIPNLCQDCHDWSRHPGTIYDASSTFAGTPSRRVVARGCINCHNMIHGSSLFQKSGFAR
ncbi:MAG: DmsE family decaheme c-type cytochrome [Proteobacteria bacterium]|nr:DmsE family decaheme c-type cytochrome [Pseudomonadota bacterium]MBU1737023.1 DmsE family decaheme c-type cytochrome [Pseudomonadota bacterium]